MLSNKAFEQWCLRLGLSDQAKAIITQIRTSPPARHVQSAADNVSGTYPSRKKGYREEIRQIALYLQAERMSLTQRQIGRYLVQPAILRDPRVRALLREVCHEVECGTNQGLC